MVLRAVAIAAIAVAALAPARRAAAGPPSGYRCGNDGAPVFGTGCRCAPDKVDARDKQDNAVCVAKPAPPVRRPAPAARAGADREAQCLRGDASASAAAGRPPPPG